MPCYKDRKEFSNTTSDNTNSGKIYYKDCPEPPPPPEVPEPDLCEERKRKMKQLDREKRGVKLCERPEPEAEPEEVEEECDYAICTDKFKNPPQKTNDNPRVCRPRKTFPDEPEYVNLADRFMRDSKPGKP